MIIWGTKKSMQTLGYVAENCPRCQAIRCVRVVRAAMVSHIYYVGMGQGRLLAYFGVCEKCAGEFVVEPMDYPELSKTKKIGLEDLALRTNLLLGATPEMRKEHERFFAVRDPFLRFNLSLEDRYATGTPVDWRAALAFLGALGGGIGLGFWAQAIEVQWLADVVGYLAGAVFIAGLVWTSWLQRKEPGRFFRKHVLPELRLALHPLQPSRAELGECLRRLEKYRYRIAKIVRAEDISEGLK
jgi:hypothetical protein